MLTVDEARNQVMLDVIADRDRSVESTIARGIRAGIAIERDRISTILRLPTPRGLEKAAIAMALSGDLTVDAVVGLFALYDGAGVTAAEVQIRRAGFHLIENNSVTEEHDACKAT